MPFPRSHARRPFAHLTSDASIEAPRLTARQQQILDWIRMHIETMGMLPTRAEIASGLGFSTASSAEDHLQALAKKGAIELKPGTSRGLRLRDFPGMPVQGTLPLVGRVAAGSPILTDEHIEGGCKVDAKCDANCDASVSAKAECTPPALKITAAAGIEAKYLASLEANLPQLIVVFKARGTAFVGLIGQVSGSLAGSVSGDIGVKGLACLNTVGAQVAAAVGQMEGAVSGSASVVASVGGS